MKNLASLRLRLARLAEALSRKARQRRLEQTGGLGVVLENDYALIPLLKGKFAKIDIEDVQLITQYWWTCSPLGYAMTNSRTSLTRYMHRVITNCPNGMEVDHINQDRLDNRKANLRICDKVQNQGNRWKSKQGKTSKFKGVSFCKRDKRFLAYGREGDKTRRIGAFFTEEEAAKAYNEWALNYFGEFAMLNIL